MKRIKVDTKRLGVLIGIVVVIIIIIAFATSGNKDNKKPTEGDSKDGTSVIEGKKLSEKKEYKGLEISNVKFSVGESLTELTAEVVNNSGSDTEGQYVNFNVLDKDGNKIMAIGGYIDAIKVGESAKISTSFASNGKEVSSYDVQITETREEEPQDNGNQEEGNN